MKIKDIITFAILGTLIFALKFTMASLPNIEPVTLLVIVYSTVYKKKSLYPILVYVILEILVYGFGLWSIGYCYIWAVLAIISVIISNKVQNCFIAAVEAAFFGLLFGALYIPVYAIATGIDNGLAWWVAGISYDILHGIANFIIVLIAYTPLTKLLTKLNKGW